MLSVAALRPLRVAALSVWLGLCTSAIAGPAKNMILVHYARADGPNIMEQVCDAPELSADRDDCPSRS